MLLLDQNVQKQIASFLDSIGIQCKRASEVGWAEKRNGDLVEACSQNGFIGILTNDQNFARSAENSLRKYPSVCIVILTLSQGPVTEYLSRFTKAWIQKAPILTAGKVIHWP